MLSRNYSLDVQLKDIEGSFPMDTSIRKANNHYMIKRIVGWLLVVSGMAVLFSPFISGFTGFFITPTAAVAATSSISLEYVIGGTITTIVGLLLIRSKRKSVLE